MRKLSPQVAVEQRRFTRVEFSRVAKLFCSFRSYPKELICNISLGGLYLSGRYDVECAELCALELYETGRNSCIILNFQVKVVRLESQGVALEFVDMTEDSYDLLQTMILYATDDPFELSLEFQEEFTSFPIRQA